MGAAGGAAAVTRGAATLLGALGAGGAALPATLLAGAAWTAEVLGALLGTGGAGAAAAAVSETAVLLPDDTATVAGGSCDLLTCRRKDTGIEPYTASR